MEALSLKPPFCWLETYFIDCLAKNFALQRDRVPIVGQHTSSSGARLALPVNEGQLATLQQRSARPVVKNLPKCCLMPSNAQQKSGPDKHRNEMAGQFFLASCPGQDFQAN